MSVLERTMPTNCDVDYLDSRIHFYPMDLFHQLDTVLPFRLVI